MPLPFGLKLKRTRRYTVSSKSCLVTRIQLLNGEFVEFTLSVESTGQECLEAVAQRLELREITYFSLWYFNKQNQQRWIDLEKPLKKQLDKYGLEPTVYFGVVFYIPSITQLQQEITRYQYYLQLKKDVLDGRISCSLEQAIRLASLAVQADFGDFNRYDSQEFLQKFVLFPIDWIQDERVLEEATQKVALLGLSAPDAEMLYMQEVEKMEGYGQESYQAKSLTLHHKVTTIYRVACKSPCMMLMLFCTVSAPLVNFNSALFGSLTDNLYMNSQNGYYYHSQTSLDCSPLEYGNGGRLRNGSVYSAHSTSSLTNPQHYLQPSPMSSNPSITSDITRPDYVPSHRHSALIPPSYRATPDYETVMRQKTRGAGGGMVLSQEHRQSHSMRNLNIGNSYAYSRPDPLVYSQPEIRGEHGGAAQQYHYPFHLEVKKMGPLKVAHLNGLSVSRQPMHDEIKDEPERASNDERCKLLEQHMERGELLKEFESIPKRYPSGECTIAQLPESGDKNRFQDVLPYDSTRVELVPTKENNTGYINASHIRITVSGQEWSYIATQGPLTNTCQDFWQMVWEQGVSIIAMVTAEEESGREKSFRYWPRLGSRHNTVTYGRFKITTRFRTESGCFATTGLKIKHLLTGQERTVWHLQYTDWPDHGCPEDFKGFLTYLEEIQSVRRHTNSNSDPKNTNLPVLVHCSAGVGRTGVVILSEIMIACLEHNEALDVPKNLLKLRAQRMLMVQTLAQYTFIYKVLIQYLRNSRLI
uniref:Protein tyrosine phosphatase non-receptor type 21 n=1 Tax=Sparus aurata TaxID=8175 RepID=A0A671V7K2_SPAAU